MSRAQLSTIAGAVLFLIALIAFQVSRYDGNVSALLHVSREFGEAFQVPHGVVLYEDGGYDGMLYYQIARDIPKILFGSRDGSLPPYDSAYRAQRILLPLFTYLLSLGQESYFPWVILLINLASITGALALALNFMRKISLPILTLVFNPAALVGVLFALSEPLSLFFTTLFLILWKRKNERVAPLHILVLAASMFARETTLFLILPLLVLHAFRKQWKDAVFLALALAPSLLWQWFLIERFGTLALTTGTHMINLPLLGVWQLLLSIFGTVSAYRLSSLSFLILFAVPLLTIELWRFARGHIKNTLEGLLLFCLLVLFSLDAHIWGVITSVGRVLTPLYPLFAFTAAERDSLSDRLISLNLIAVSIIAAIGIASITHPFSIS